MPYKSDAQRKKFHAMLDRGEIDAATVREWDKASEGRELPERVRKRKEHMKKLFRKRRGRR